MTQPALKRAYLQGIRAPGKSSNKKAEPRDIPGALLEFDFNPETLTVEVSNSLEDKGRAFKKRQFVTGVVSKLSFEAVFDHTRPGPHIPDGASAANPQTLDIRRRTSKLVELLDAKEIKRKPLPVQDAKKGSKQGANQGDKKAGKKRRPRTKKPAPALVRFHWGSFIFQGVLEQYSETLEYFTPDGVPLRARVSVTLTQQKYLYDPGKDTSSKKTASNPAQPNSSTSDDDDLPWFAALDRAQGFEASMGLGFDGGWSMMESFEPGGLGTSMAFDAGGAFPTGGLDLSLPAGLEGALADSALALEVMGARALEDALGGVADVSQTTLGTLSAAAHPDGRATSWAPEGLSPETRAARIAEAILQDGSVTLRVRGMPPRARRLLFEEES